MMTMTSASGSSCLNFRTSSMPSTSGSIMSVTTTSGCHDLKNSSPRAPMSAVSDLIARMLEQDFQPLGHRRLIVYGEALAAYASGP